METQLPLPKGTQIPNIQPKSVVAKTAGWLKMPLDMQVGLGPSDFVLDADPPPLPKKGAEPPIFGPLSILAKRLEGSR